MARAINKEDFRGMLARMEREGQLARVTKRINSRHITCPFRKSYPDVFMMQPSQDGNGDNSARSLDCSMQGRIFL